MVPGGVSLKGPRAPAGGSLPPTAEDLVECPTVKMAEPSSILPVRHLLMFPAGQRRSGITEYIRLLDAGATLGTRSLRGSDGFSSEDERRLGFTAADVFLKRDVWL